MNGGRRDAGRSLVRKRCATLLLVWTASLAGDALTRPAASAQVVGGVAEAGETSEESDGDAVLDVDDNCDVLPNPEMADADGVGDRCEAVVDTVAPVLQAPPPITVDATDAKGAVVTFEVTAMDNGLALTPTCKPPSGSVFPIGTTTVTCTATDAAKNTAAISFDVTVRPASPTVDTVAPVLQAPPPITVDATDAKGAVVTFEVTAMDNGLALTPTCKPPSGSVFPIGTTTVTCTATDAAKNTAAISFDVTMRPASPTSGTEPTPDPRTPVAADDAVDTVAGVAVTIAFLTNDVDPGGNAEARIVARPANGSVEVLEGLLSYTPQASFVGSDSLSYRLCRGDLPDLCDSATVTIRIHPAQGKAQTALAEPVWQTISQRPSETLPSGCQGALAWGGFANGRIPTNQMAAIGGNQLLESTAATAFAEMRAAAERAGVGLPLTDSYRSFDEQVSARQRKGALVSTATPGTSVHGWGKAIDVNIGSQALRSWMEQNSVRFGWVNPAWAQRAGKSHEPWHYEFYGARPGGGVNGCTPITTAASSAGTPDTATPGSSESPRSNPGPGTTESGPEGAEVGITHTSIFSRNRGARTALGLLALVASAIGLKFAAREFLRRSHEDEGPPPT